MSKEYCREWTTLLNINARTGSSVDEEEDNTKYDYSKEYEKFRETLREAGNGSDEEC